MIVIVIEVAFENHEGDIIKDAMQRILEEARTEAAARVIGSYDQTGTFEENIKGEWGKKAVNIIKINQPVEIEID